MLSPFAKLNLIQFLAAINENLFKLLVMFFLIQTTPGESASNILSLVGAVFIAPFLLFSTLGGVFADRFHKNRITILTRWGEVGCLLLAMLAFSLREPLFIYATLFGMATLAAFFGPAKYALIPEILPPSRILRANELISCFTYLGIIFGTTLSSTILTITHESFFYALLLTVAISLTGAFLSLFLPLTPLSSNIKKTRHFWSEFTATFHEMKAVPTLPLVFFLYTYFLFIGAFAQLNIVSYTTEVLHFPDQLSGYFFLLTALGIGISALLTKTITKGNLRFIPHSGVAIGITFYLLAFLGSPFWLTLVWMFLLGLFGGIFIVLTQNALMEKSPANYRGRNFGAANLVSFAFALLASLFLYVLSSLAHFSPKTNFAVIGSIQLILMLFIYKAPLRASKNLE